MNELPDYYAILGVHPEAEDEVIAAAYRALAKKYHPDTGAKGTASSARFMEVNEAFEVLRDPDRRKAYDEERRFRSSNMGNDQAGGDDEHAAAPEAQETDRQEEPTKTGDTPKKSEHNISPVATALVWGAIVIVSTVALVEFSKERSAPGQTVDRAATVDPAEAIGQPVANVGEKGSLLPQADAKDLAPLAVEEEVIDGQSQPTEQRSKEIHDRIVGDQEIIGGQMMPTEEIPVQPAAAQTLNEVPVSADTTPIPKPEAKIEDALPSVDEPPPMLLPLPRPNNPSDANPVVIQLPNVKEKGPLEYVNVPIAANKVDFQLVDRDDKGSLLSPPILPKAVPSDPLVAELPDEQIPLTGPADSYVPMETMTPYDDRNSVGEPQPATPVKKQAEAPPATGSGFVVQLSSFRSEADARKEYTRLAGAYPHVVGGLPQQIRQTSVGGSTRYQLGLGPLPSRSAATKVCSALITQGESDCVVRGRDTPPAPGPKSWPSIKIEAPPPMPVPPADQQG